MTGNGKKKDYNLTLLPFWSTKGEGRYMSIVVQPEHYDALQKVEIGGRLTFKLIEGKNENSPQAYLEYITKAKVEAFKNRNGAAANADVDI